MNDALNHRDYPSVWGDDGGLRKSLIYVIRRIVTANRPQNSDVAWTLVNTAWSVVAAKNGFFVGNSRGCRDDDVVGKFAGRIPGQQVSLFEQILENHWQAHVSESLARIRQGRVMLLNLGVCGQ